MADIPSDDKFVTSTYCGNGTCVAVALCGDGVYVRNEKDPDKILKFDRTEWDDFLKGAKAGEFDLK